MWDGIFIVNISLKYCNLFVGLFRKRITSALREYLWDKGLDFLRHGFALFYMEKQSIWAEAMENGDLEFLQKREHTFEISMFCIDIFLETKSRLIIQAIQVTTNMLGENKEFFCTQKTVNYPALFFFT